MTNQFGSGFESYFDSAFGEDSFFARAEPLTNEKPDTPPKPVKPSGCHPILWYELPVPVRHLLQRLEHRQFCWQASAQTTRDWQNHSPNQDRLLISWDGRQAEPVTNYRQGLHNQRSVYAFRTPLPASDSPATASGGHAATSLPLPSRFGGGPPVEGGNEYNAMVRIVQPEQPGARLRQDQRPIRQTRERYRLANDQTWWDLAFELYGVPHATPLANINHPDYSMARPPRPGQNIWAPGPPVLGVTGTSSYGRAVRV